MKRILLVLIMLHAPLAGILADESLYSGSVVVPGQGEEDRKAALPEAFIQVLQKLSGLREIPISPQLDQALLDAEKLLLSFQYRNVDRTGPDGGVNQELRLVAQFMPREVDRVVIQLGLPRWQLDRPAVQIWVVVDDGRNRDLKPVEFNYAWEAMADVATFRGLPVSWPELDEEEEQLIDMRLVWGGFTDYLVERGAPADGVVIIAARREGPVWTLRWHFSNGEQNSNWRTSDQELMFALAQGIHQMTDLVAAGNTIAVSEQGVWTIDITVGELNSANDYAFCLQYLQDLSLVTDVEILGADPGRVHFRLRINASPEHLSDAFERGTVLLRSSAASEYQYELLSQGLLR